MEIENSELNLNGEIVEKYIGTFGGENQSVARRGSAHITDKGLVILKKGHLSNKVNSEIFINFNEIQGIKLRQKGLFKPGAIKIYTESKKFYIEKKKAEKLEPFFQSLKEKLK